MDFSDIFRLTECLGLEGPWRSSSSFWHRKFLLWACNWVSKTGRGRAWVSMALLGNTMSCVLLAVWACCCYCKSHHTERTVHGNKGAPSQAHLLTQDCEIFDLGHAQLPSLCCVVHQKWLLQTLILCVLSFSCIHNDVFSRLLCVIHHFESVQHPPCSLLRTDLFKIITHFSLEQSIQWIHLGMGCFNPLPLSRK